MRLLDTWSGGRGLLSGFGTLYHEHRKSDNMGEFRVAGATKIAVAPAEAIILRLVLELRARLSAAFGPAAA
ncbi:hypothetical protein [Streptomyces mirabilis]|uniref:hypothetical protein n=1 Tax=Streptomyces mirabilis TaxID=68239 RepID=UPI00369379E6